MALIAHPHGKNLRKGRVSLANQVYLVTSVTENRQRWFADFYLGRILVNCLREHQVQGNIDSLAFVVMPDHFHWLIELKSDVRLSETMRRVKGHSARLIGSCLEMQGKPQPKLWQAGFYDHALRQEEDLKALARYVIANPLRAGLVSRIGDYPLWDAKWLV